MMTKLEFVNFLSRLIPYGQYSICTKFHVKWTKIFDTACFFTTGQLDFQKSSAQIGLKRELIKFFIEILYLISEKYWFRRRIACLLFLHNFYNKIILKKKIKKEVEKFRSLIKEIM